MFKKPILSPGVSMSIGFDPEVFVIDKKTGRGVCPTVIPGPGTKEQPNHIDVHHPHITWQYDGMAIEFNTSPSVASGYTDIEVTRPLNMIKRLISDQGYDVVAKAVMFFDKEYYDRHVPESQKELGCDPDFNAYLNGAVNPRPTPPENDPRGVMRTGGGHIHIGVISSDKHNLFDIHHQNYMLNCSYFIRNLDHILMHLSKKWDTNEERRLMYGAPGAFRPKKYGVEYRSLSNEWLNHPELPSYLHRMCKYIYEATMVGMDFLEFPPDDIVSGKVDEHVPKFKRLYQTYAESLPWSTPVENYLTKR